MRIVLAGGGSGGHFYPLIAITESIHDIVKEKKLLQAKIYYLAPNPYNQALLFDNEIEYQKIYAGKIRRYFSIQNALDIVLTGFGFIQAFFKMFAIYPDVVISKGGFMSLPVVFAAHILRIPIIVHEGDSVPGRANLWASKYATRVAISFAEAAEYFPKDKVALVGNPLRKQILRPLRDGAGEYLHLEPGIPTIAIYGGSLGSKVINDAILSSLLELLPTYQILHQTGRDNFKEVSETAGVVLEGSKFKDRYHAFDYLDVLALRMVAGVADIFISRGGSSIFELAAWGVPSIIIPISDSNGDHQRKNSFNYARSGAAVVIDENNLTPEILATNIKDILSDPERVKKMREAALAFAKTDAAYKIAEEAVGIALSHEA